MTSKRKRKFSIRRIAHGIDEALMDGLDLGKILMLLLLAFVILFFVSVPILLIFYPWGRIFVVFSEIMTNLMFGLFIIYVLFHFFLRSSAWIKQGSVVKFYAVTILLALAFGLYFSPLIATIIPSSAEILGRMLCPNGYQDFITELAARRHDMPGIVVSYGLQDMKCVGELGTYRPRPYHLFLGSFLLAALPLLSIAAIVHAVERLGQKWNAPWKRRAISILLAGCGIALLSNYPAPMISAAKLLNKVFTASGGYSTLLHRYAEKGDLENVRKRIEIGDTVNANASSEYDLLPLFYAVRGGHVEVARVLLENGADPSRGLIFPLHLAVQINSPEMARLLLQYGADVNFADKTGLRALSIVAMGLSEWRGDIAVPADAPRLEMMRILLEHGANTKGIAEIMAERLVPPLPPDLMALLGESQSSYVARMGKHMKADDVKYYIWKDKIDWLRSYLQAGGDPDAVGNGKWGNYRGLTLLGVALVEEKLEAMRMLLKNGANADKARGPVYNGGTMCWAAKYSPPEAVSILLDGGANPTKKNSYGKTPLQLACSKGRISVAQIIAKKMSKGSTPKTVCN